VRNNLPRPQAVTCSCRARVILAELRSGCIFVLDAKPTSVDHGFMLWVSPINGVTRGEPITALHDCPPYHERHRHEV
jgi:hypothetical protein